MKDRLVIAQFPPRENGAGQRNRLARESVRYDKRHDSRDRPIAGTSCSVRIGSDYSIGTSRSAARTFASEATAP